MLHPYFLSIVPLFVAIILNIDEKVVILCIFFRELGE